MTLNIDRVSLFRELLGDLIYCLIVFRLIALPYICLILLIVWSNVSDVLAIEHTELPGLQCIKILFCKNLVKRLELALISYQVLIYFALVDSEFRKVTVQIDIAQKRLHFRSRKDLLVFKGHPFFGDIYISTAIDIKGEQRKRFAVFLCCLLVVSSCDQYHLCIFADTVDNVVAFFDLFKRCLEDTAELIKLDYSLCGLKRINSGVQFKESGCAVICNELCVKFKKFIKRFNAIDRFDHGHEIFRDRLILIVVCLVIFISRLDDVLFGTLGIT